LFILEEKVSTPAQDAIARIDKVIEEVTQIRFPADAAKDKEPEKTVPEKPQNP
jgi:hypothetical protein